MIQDGKKKFYELTSIPFHNKNQALAGRIIMIHDATEYSLMQEELTRQRIEYERTIAEKKYHVLFEQSRDPIFISTREGRFVDINQSMLDLFGYTREEMMELAVEKIHTNPSNLKTLQEKIEQYEFVKDHDVTLRKKNGQEIDCLVTSTLRRGDKGEIIGYQGIIRDVTQQRRMHEQIIITDRLASIGQLASGIGHELNNPLTGIIGFTDLLIKRDLPGNTMKYLESINREAKRAANIVKGLLTFVHTQKLEKEPIDINSIVDEVLQLRSYQQRESNIQVIKNLSTELPQVIGNIAQLQQVFMNITINAEQAIYDSHTGGTLAVTTEPAGDMVRISFTDDGPGISPDNIRRLFTPFFTTKDVGKGTGLGLSICHGIIIEHGGKIYAESELGKGTAIIIELPVIKE